jgi:Tol biopolymer transport system component
MRRTLAALGTGGILAVVLLGSRAQPVAENAPPTKLPAAIGAIHPRQSPDGALLAFSYQGGIWVAPRTGGTMTLLSTGEGEDTEPAWSRDGRRIAFVRGTAVKLIETASGNEVPLSKPLLTAGTYGANKLEFSADGRQLLGGFRTDGKDHGLAWFDLATGAVRSLAPVHSYTRFALSPDGKWIARTEPPDKPGEQTGNDGSHTDVWKIPADGGNAEKLCRFPARIHDLYWADGGRSLVVAAELGQAHDDLWKLPLHDPLRGMTKLTSGQADEDQPSASRDGRWLAYTDNRDGPTAIIVRDFTTGQDVAVRFDVMDYRRPTGTLRLRLIDAATKAPVVARVSLKEVGGRFHAPPGSMYRSLRGTSHFCADQIAELTVPAGTYRLKAYRGPEYRVASQEIRIAAGEARDVTVELERWAHMARSGWYSGELHIHANYGYGAWFNTPGTMRRQCAGEDLNVCNFMVANSDADVVYDRPYFRGGPDPLSTPDCILYWNQEFRSTVWGHMTLVNLRQVVEPVFTGFAGTTNPWDSPSNADVADRTHWQQGVVNYTHVSQGEDWSRTPYAAKAIPIDAALGKVDTLDVNNSWAASVALWYRLLNCGLRLPATAGTDVFLNRIGSNLPGGDRVYVRLDGPLTYESWIAGLKSGRSFVTSGPMLEFTVNGTEPGGVLKLGQKPQVRVKAKARSQFPLTRAEVVHNGRVVATAALSADRLTASLDQELTLDRGGWLAFRANGPGTPDTPTSALNAHTNPVYVEIGGAMYRSAAEARAFLKWIDQFELLLRGRDRFPTPSHRQQAQEQLETARQFYVRIVREAAD